jgi:hypothetical protein
VWQVWLIWGVTRATLLVAAIIGQRFCDPQFYHYAGQFAAGHLPYRDFGVEYPPLAVILTLLPALPLLPFAGIAPRPDPAFHSGLTSLPAPDPMRYGAYGVSFAVMMLLIDALTLWLVMRVGRRIASGDTNGAISGLISTLLTVAVGALLQKFDLAAGALCLLAIYGLLIRRPYLAWSALAAKAEGGDKLATHRLCFAQGAAGLMAVVVRAIGSDLRMDYNRTDWSLRTWQSAA